MTFYRALPDVVRETRQWAISDHPRIPTGYPLMDSRTDGGAALGEVILFQARSSVGKTMFANNVIANNAGRPIVFFSLEMHSRYIALRQAAILAGQSTKDITDQLKRGDRSALQALVDSQPMLAIIDKPAMSLKEMSYALEEVKDAWGVKPELVVIDYLELVGGVPSLNAVEKVDGVARKVKDMTREHDVVTLLLHQVGRGEGGAGAEPLDLASARYGGETQADYVLAAYRPCLRKGISQDEYLVERWAFYLQFLKSRGGSEIHPAGDLHCLNPHSLRLTWPYPAAPLWDDDPYEEAF